MNQPKLQPVDQAQRDRIANGLMETLAVEAGAGTGKTTLLIDRLAALIREFDVARLAAITFTEKASAELADRLRRKLEGLATSSTTPPDYRMQLLKALTDFDRARFSTIHAFAASLLRERPVEVELDPEFDLLRDEDEQELLDDILETDLSRPDSERDPQLLRFRLGGGKFKRLRDGLLELNANRDLLEALPPPPALSAATEWLPDFAGAFTRLNDQALTHCPDPADGARKQTEALFHTIPASAPDEDDIPAWKWLEAVASLRSTAGNKSAWDDPATCKQHKDELKELKQRAEEILERRRIAITVSLLLWMARLVETAAETRRARGTLTFQDQLIYARALLRQGAVLSHFRSRYQRLLIDEFQDTDPLQVEIALLLSGVDKPHSAADRTRVEPGKLFIVGDPKQSIYRFRRADPRVYRGTVARMLGADAPLIISQNFRAAPDLVAFVNRFFGWLWERVDCEGITYQPIQAEPGRLPSLPAPSVALLTPASAWSGERPSVDVIRAAEAAAVAELIRRAVGSERWEVAVRSDQGWQPRPAGYSDIVLLFPTWTGLEHYTRALTAAGIPFMVEGGKLAYHRAAVMDLYHCLAAIDNPGDSFSVVGALRSSLLGIRDDELMVRIRERRGDWDYRRELPGRSDAVQCAEALLRSLHRQRTRLTPDRIIAGLLNQTDALEALEAWNGDDGDLAMFHRVLDQARAYGREHGPGLRGFRRWLQGKMEEDNEREPAPSRPDAARVRLMTVHGAKGLEFPIVILADLNNRGQGNRKNSVIADHSTLQVHLSLGYGFQTSGFADADEYEKRAGESERMRLLYVAMTRARDHLVLPCFYGDQPQGQAAWLSEFLASCSTEDAASLPFRRVTLDSASAASTVHPAPETSPPVNANQVRSEAAQWLRDRESRLNLALGRLPQVIRPSAHPPTEEQPETRVPESKSVDAAGLGRALHRYLATCAPALELDSSLAARCAREEEVDVEKLAPLIQSCLNSGLWRDAISAQAMWREVPVMVELEGLVLRGSVDLIYLDYNGELALGDWKSGASDLERHRRQLSLYVSAVERGSGLKVSSARLFFATSGEAFELRK